MGILKATDHAYDRAKERLGWKKATLDRMMVLAYNNGLSHSQTKGRLNRYITKLWLRNQNCDNIRIYGENIFFFAGEVLVTLYRLDNQLVKHLKYQKND